MKPIYAIMLVILMSSISSYGQTAQKTKIAFYNLENLFDTIPNPEIGDRDYTPQGKLNWNTQRYATKIENLAKVIDQMSADILGVCEIENENTLRDLVRALKTDYNYIHVTSNNSRGIDIALLYKADKFTPTKTRIINSSYSREFIHVKGNLLKQQIDIVVCHLPSNFNSAEVRQRVMTKLADEVDSLRRANNFAKIIIMGDFNANPTDKLVKQTLSDGLFNPFCVMQRKGMGTYVFNDRWVLFDNIILSNTLLNNGLLQYNSSAIFIQDYMISQGTDLRRGYPKRTFVSGKYVGGYSDHLPVYVILERY